ncbi:MAG: MBL fold metallo-hydrolase [Clostridiales bacterium]|nr:MBL fold metallo-hydrolase [Clostridiales bacterium]
MTGKLEYDKINKKNVAVKEDFSMLYDMERKMKIVVFKYGECLYPENKIFYGVKSEKKIPMSFCFYLIQTDKKNILVDVGCDGKERYNFYVYAKTTDLLSQYGLTPDDITDVIITHAHFDHIDDLGYYKKAMVHIQRNEVQKALPYIKNREKVNIFEEEITIEQNITIKKYGGHTAGSCIVYAGKCVLCGDECYFPKNFEEKIPTGNSYCLEKSQAFVDNYGNGEYKPLLFHSPDILSGEVGFLIVYED